MACLLHYAVGAFVVLCSLPSPLEGQRTRSLPNTSIEGPQENGMRARELPVTADQRKIYGFDALPEPNTSLDDLNRVVSALRPALGTRSVIDIARLALDSSVSGEPSPIAVDEDGIALRLAVGDYYFRVYGDAWRSMDAYASWWQQFRRRIPLIAPVISKDEQGNYLLAIKRLVLAPGRHPQVENWNLKVSRDGQVQVRSMALIFPVQPSWMFFDGP